MIKVELFNKFDRDDPLEIVKYVFNSFGNSSDFPEIVDCLLSKEGTSINYEGCRFPGDLDEGELYNDYNGVPFEGVECWAFDKEITVPENEFFKLLKIACDRYIELHPDRKDELEKIMSQSTLI